MKAKRIKRSFIMSLTSLLLCFCMLLGTTFAWFTDTVTSANNQIVAGNLDVELYYQAEGQNDWTKVTADTNVFMEDTLWEPGHTEVVKLKVENAGSLALKYQLGVNVVSETGSVNMADEDFMLSDHIKFGIVEGDQTYSRAQAVEAVDASAVPLKTGYSSNMLSLLPKNAANNDNETIVTMVVYMPTTVENEANHGKGQAQPTIKLGINLFATQLDYEADSFGPDYDAKVKHPSHTTTGETTLTSNSVTVTVPKGAPAGVYELEVTDIVFEESTFTCDISLTCDGQPVAGKEGVTYPVEIQLDYMLDIHELRHNGETLAAYTYDPLTNVISFETDSFSPFAIDFTRMGRFVKVENRKLTAGLFDMGYDPTGYDSSGNELDPSLKEPNSEYIAVSYQANGENCFVVGKRSETMIWAAADSAEYTPVYDNYSEIVPKTVSGKLYSEIAALKANDHNTVCLLPGTYNEATTIYIGSSMDIFGLGEKDSVQIIKSAASNSNRHLLNASGEKSDYIEVTIHNLYLDATANTTGGKDNGAVQAIRKSKVKCYDLTIMKGTGWSSKAFYSNGTNKVDDVVYPGYLYAENCALSSTSSSGVVDMSGSAKFYHSGVTYNNGTAYTQNSGNTKNIKMDFLDWEWD